MACGKDCLNRILLIECDPKTCPNGARCTNRRLQLGATPAVDVFPAGDLGIRQAIAALDGSTELPSEADCRARAEVWRPHRSLAAQHLWASLHIDDRSSEENH